MSRDAVQRGRGTGLWSDARWLAWRDIRGAWVSFAATAFAASLVGAFAGTLLNGVFFVVRDGSGESPDVGMNSFMLDLWFLFLVPLFITQNVLLNREYASYWRTDYLSKRLHFLRSLPIEVRELVAGRVLVLLFSVLVLAPFFFAPLYLVSDLEGEPAGLGFGGHLWFALVWVGYSLAFGGANLYGWLAVSGRTSLWIALAATPAAFLAVALLDWWFGIPVVMSTLELSRTRGPLVAVFALAVGSVGLFLWARLMERRLRRRDLSA